MIMNIIVLTPDRVGSTLLQKFLTITMQNYDYGKPVINLHEITNGIRAYHSDFYNQNVVGKPPADEWGYHQSLEEVVKILDSADCYKVSRLAQYHLLNRKDNLKDQLSLYKYINDNFFVISARRENLFEHALSWCIVAFTKHLNIYTHEEKIDVFHKLYKKKITIDQEVFKNYLDKYLVYLKWVDDHFRVNSVFNYEKHMKDLEGYVNNLDIFPDNQETHTWKDSHGISWNDWNKCHYLISDMSGFSTSIGYDKPIELLNAPSTESKPTNSMGLERLVNRSDLSVQHQELIKASLPNYYKLYMNMAGMIQNGTLITGVPIKLQTLAEKAVLVKNFKECMDTYNEWSLKNNLSHQFTLEDLGEAALTELKDWYDVS